MRFASQPGEGRDGELVLVSEDLATCRPVTGMSLLAALDAGLGDEALAARAGPQQPFDPAAALAPLPRAVQFLDGSAYVNHVALVRQARGAEMPDRFWTDPLMYQGLSCFLPPAAPIAGDSDWGLDFEAEIAVITGDIPRGTNPEDAARAIRAVCLLNDISLRHLIPDELSKGFGFVQSKPASALSPLAVTPDDLPGWDGRRLSGILRVDLNGAPFGRADAGVDMTFDFGDLLSHAAKTRDLPAGTVVGSGTISNRDPDGGPGRPVSEDGLGYSCIAEQRMVETIRTGSPRTPFLQPGDRVRIWMEDETGRSIFGAIDQVVTALPG